jgi:2-amino-4-hydroxy-6-hydroxymethyldihydropteridine diphosphokinase
MALNNIFSNIFGRGGKKKMKKAKKASKKNTKKPAKKAVKKAKKKVAKKQVKKPSKKPTKKPTKKKAKKTINKKAQKPIVKAAEKKAAVKPVIAPKAKKTELKLKKGPHTVYLGLGCNVGDREEYIEQAIFLLSKTPGIKMVKKSVNFENDAQGPGDQPAYLNAAVEISTMLDPYKLLQVTQDIENVLGREREVDWGPRTMDLDILLYDDQIISDDKLQIPHPLLHERLFVLKPLSEIAPKAMHPMLERTILDLYEERKSDVGDKYDDDLPGFKDIKKGTPDDFERW